MVGILLHMLTFLFIVENVLCDYDCICNYNVEKAIFPVKSEQAQPIGYMYEFDCKEKLEEDGAWLGVAFEHQVAYFQKDSQVQLQTCPGNPSAEDRVTTPKPLPTTTNLATTEPSTVSSTSSSTFTTATTATSKVPSSAATTTSFILSTATTGTTEPLSYLYSSSTVSSLATLSSTSPSTETISTFKSTNSSSNTESAATTAAIPSTSRSNPTSASTTAKFSSALLSTSMSTSTLPSSKPTAGISTKTSETTSYTSSSTTSTFIPTTSSPSTVTSTLKPITTTIESTTSTTIPTTSSPSTVTSTLKPITTTIESTSASSSDLFTISSTAVTNPSTHKLSPSTESSSMGSSASLPTSSSLSTGMSSPSSPSPPSSSASTMPSSSQPPKTSFSTVPISTQFTTHSQTTSRSLATVISVQTTHGSVLSCNDLLNTTATHDGGMLFAYKQKCYELVRTLKNWVDAEIECRHKGAHLIKIDNSNEQKIVYDVIRKHYHKSIWIGLHDLHHEEQFEWTEGGPVLYTNWNPNRKHPENYWHEDCVSMEIDLEFGEWDDHSCTELRGFVCQFGRETLAAPALIG